MLGRDFSPDALLDGRNLLLALLADAHPAYEFGHNHEALLATNVD